jgi:hypothetical protein
MPADRASYLDREDNSERNGEQYLVKTGSQVIHESDVTSWLSVFRLLLGVLVAALVHPVPRGYLGVTKPAGRSLVA